MKKQKHKNNFLPIAGVIALGALIATLVGIEIYCWISFGGKPVSEIPTWALIFLFHK